MTEDAPRIEALLQAMTLEDKLGQLTMIRADFDAAGSTLLAPKLAEITAGHAGSVLDLRGATALIAAQKAAVENSRLKIPLLFTLDVLHGYRTIFPVPLGEAAAFDPDLWERTARAASVEAAADGIALTYAPMLDVARDPRWGRIVESAGEDAFVTARFAEAKVEGFQTDDLSRSDALAATAKHFAGYAAVNAGREYASADFSQRTFEEVYLPPFAASVNAGVAAIMPAFIEMAGVPLTAHRALLTGVLRERLGFDGVLISDFFAVAELIKHGVAADAAEAAALALNAGVDIDMASGTYTDGLPEVLARGLVRIETIDAAVRRVLALKLALGLFDKPYARGEHALAPGTIDAHRALAREAARKSIVLLQNNGVLPLSAQTGRLAVIGPLADAPGEMLGPWRAAGEASEAVSFLEGVKAAFPHAVVFHASGADIAAALEAARSADAVILCIGETANMSGEANSRARPVVPDAQRALAEAVFGAGKPVVAVLTSGRPLIAPWLFEKADAVIAAWFLGSEAGNALGDILGGAVSLSGKLPLSWPLDAGQIPIFYGERPTGRPADPENHDTSKYIDVPNEPLFPFGHGLTYTRFDYGEPRASAETLKPGECLTVEVDITNIGGMAAEEIVYLFIRDPLASVTRPFLELKAFTKIKTLPGERATVRFALTTADFSFPDADAVRRIEPGEIEILTGPSADAALLTRCRVRVVTVD
ncbi:glycoside hydrolase family 3 C-terminal domain-containing protein [Rhodomicrobium sp. Az07]|uniref:glycoside hydrolase family 3 N-terminal domain-containing protein n=1 Tax=Rhodomicrobium sp. Az07 TaxID=2839034 RepID=UPI001BE63AE2|nr:glycoside hydrolase family 3 N-terminal domain-containing protein [Rhodomicrobium sp. Az07]MBT3069317.1 glycoside hydrolase family 3 C-terminal domain-containing protein [Rhodomicrobium sp. Az07]